jgi:5-methylcytosine-specific restriction endonuclease McrBC GTP-binding regulatory subunit McrB
MTNVLHEKVFEFCESYRASHPDFLYWLRVRNTKNRFEEGVWFQGKEDYAFVGFYKRGGGTNMTRSVGLVFGMDGDNISCAFENVFNEEKDPKVLSLYEKLREFVGGMNQIHQTKYRKLLSDVDGFAAATEFLNSTKAKLDGLVLKNKLDDFIITKTDFETKLEKIQGYRLRLVNDEIGKFIITNITWNSNGWKEPSDDKSGHKWVAKGGQPHESWNFDFENPRNTGNKVLGFAQFTNAPLVTGSGNLIIFYSQNKIVGFYGKAEILKEPVPINEYESYNLIGDRNLCLHINTEIDNVKEKGYLGDKQRVGQTGFTYLNDLSIVNNILEEALTLNPDQSIKLNKIKEWVNNEKPTSPEVEPNYWIFQGSPNIYRIADALKDKKLKTWKVSAHKTEIKIGDKVILWITGDKSGCYALCKVISSVENIKDDDEELKYYIDKSDGESIERVQIEIEHNWWDLPVLKQQIESLPEFTDFYGGKQGTNYVATKAQYEKLQELYYEERIINILKGVGNRNLIEQYFQLLSKLVNRFKLTNENSRISFSSPKNSRNLISATIGQRYVVSLKNEEKSSEPEFEVSLIAAKKDEDIFKESHEFIKFEEFASHSSKEVPPNYAYFNETVLPLNEELTEAWFSAVNEELKLFGMSSFRQHHNPQYFKAVVDSDYLNYLLNKVFNPNNQMETKPLNQILYGPPGTGKTYRTIDEAIKIVDGDYYKRFSDNHDELQKQFNNLIIKDWEKAEGQISFCTFHQSFSYEDFVEGIKPLKPEKTDQSVKYDIEDGVFKKICRLADASNNAQKLAKDNLVSLTQEEFNNASFYKISLGDSTKDEDKDIYTYCINNGVIAIGFGESIDFTGKDESAVKEIVKEEKLEEFTAQAINIFKNYLKTGNYVVVSYGNTYIRALGKVTSEYLFNPDTEIRYNHFRNVEWIFKNVEIPVTEFYQNKIIQQTIYKLKSEFIIPSFFVRQAKQATAALSQKNFVLVIDEINRGNISSIFGELITLIEPNKRSGKKEALEVVLPYSKLSFTVPDNVYIIGTMNTADRSIEALDTALRRRFTFVEIAPDPALIKEKGVSNGEIEGIDLVKMLETINNRIEKLIDKDHMIGHSYFLDISDISGLKEAFRNKIIPLLEEYFYGDYGKIGLVLGDKFVFNKYETKKDFGFAQFEGYDNDVVQDLKDRKVYSISEDEEWKADTFISIYQPKKEG